MPLRADLNLHLPVAPRDLHGKTAPSPEAEAAQLDKAAREFEALLVEQMVKAMRDAMPKADLLGREPGQELFNEMLDGEMVRILSDRGGMGMSEALVASLRKVGTAK